MSHPTPTEEAIREGVEPSRQRETLSFLEARVSELAARVSALEQAIGPGTSLETRPAPEAPERRTT